MGGGARGGWLGAIGRREDARAAGPESLRVHASFEGGNVDRVDLLSPEHLRFHARADSSPRPLWFYFCIEGARVPAVRCELANADDCLGPRHGWRTARPVFSADGRIWHRVARAEYVEESAERGCFRFMIPVVGPRVYVAYCYPYTTADLCSLIRSLPQRQGLRAGELCRSPENRPVPYLRFGNHETPNQCVWLLARQHAGETPASYTIEGAIQHLTRLDPQALESLSDTAFHIIPMVDVDGVYHGRFGKDEQPVDCNRDWREQPQRPETLAAIRAMRESQRLAPIGLVLDLHAPHQGDTSCYAFGWSQEEGGPLFVHQERFLRCLARASPLEVGFRETDLRTDRHPDCSAREFLSRTLSVPVLTIEMSYHLAQSGDYLTPAHYRSFGAALMRAVHGYFRGPSVGRGA